MGNHVESVFCFNSLAVIIMITLFDPPTLTNPDTPPTPKHGPRTKGAIAPLFGIPACKGKVLVSMEGSLAAAEPLLLKGDANRFLWELQTSLNAASQ